jgi:hypothetical protein
MSTRPILTAVAALALPAAAAAQIVPSGAPGNATAFPGWNIAYRLPAGWQVQQTVGRLQTLVSGSAAGAAVFVGPGPYTRAEEAIADLSIFYSLLGLQAYPVEPPTTTTVAGMPAVTATYASMNQWGQQIHGRFISVFTPHGTGFSMLAMGPPQQMPSLAPVLDAIAASVTAQPPEVNQAAMAALAGQWILYDGGYRPTVGSSGGYSRSHEETVVFDGQGGYRWQSTSQVSVTADFDMGGASGINSAGDQGTYVVIGTTLIFKGTKGQLAVDYVTDGTRLVAAGKTYLRQ